LSRRDTWRGAESLAKLAWCGLLIAQPKRGVVMDMMDCVGIPEYFVTHIGAIEDAGNGMIRVIRCIKRGELLIPVVSCIVPAIAMLIASPILREAAQKIVRGECGSSH